ncbi:MAG: GGDEF domain-containing protein [Gammaproteobacteria bacterium]|nr:GGDEF domain-containing protein [Gammaproteobacteria bacterium]
MYAANRGHSSASTPSGLLRRASRLGILMAAFSLFTGMTVLASWYFEFPSILAPIAGRVTPQPWVAVCVVLLSSCQLLGANRLRMPINITLLGVLAIVAVGLGWSDETGDIPGLLELLPGAPSASVMNSETVRLCLLLVSLSLLLRDFRNALQSQTLAVIAFGLPLTALAAKTIGAPDSQVQMSFTNVFMLLPLCVAAGLATVYRGFFRALLGPTRASAIARRYLYAILLAPYLTGIAIMKLSLGATDLRSVVLVVSIAQIVSLLIGFLALSFSNFERLIRVQQRKAERLIRRDTLTGALNRRAFTEQAEREIERRGAPGTGLSLLFVDLDHFKSINDRLGHSVGDRVLKRLIRVTRSCLRSRDCVARWGGEEFLVLLPDTDRAGAQLISEKIRQRIARECFAELEDELRVTVSIGCTELALYRAKHKGRNRTEVV